MHALFRLASEWELGFVPFGTDKKGCDVKDVSEEAVRESVAYFEEKGGSLDELAKELNAKLSGLNRRRGHRLTVTPAILRKGVACRDEFYFVMTLLMKGLMGDVDFCYRLPDDGLLSEEHAPWEAGPNEFWRLGGITDVPWGDREGTPVRENSVRSIATVYATLEDVVRSDGGDVGEAKRKFFDLVNSFVEPQYRVNEGFIRTKDNWVSYRFSQLMYEAAKIVSGQDDILCTAGRRNISDAILVLGKIWGIQKTYEKMAFYSGRFTRAFNYTPVEVGSSYAIIRADINREYARKMGRYFRRFVKNSCDMSRNTMGAVPRLAFGLVSHEPLETACMVKQIPRDVLTRLPSGISKKAFDDISSRFADGGANDYCEFVYSWVPTLTGWRRLADPKIVAGLSALPMLALWAQDVEPAWKVVGTAVGLLPTLAAQLGSVVRRYKQIIAKQDETLREKLDEVESIKAAHQRAELELRTKLSERILTNAANLLLQRRYGDAAEEFKAYLAHAVDPRALLHYTLAVFKKREDYLSDVLGAKIKVVALGEGLEDVEGLERRLYFKQCPSFDDAVTMKDLSEMLAGSGVVSVELPFDDGEHGYIVVEEVHQKDRPGVRAPSLLELKESGRAGKEITDTALAVAARIYSRLWEVKQARPDLIGAVCGPDGERAVEADLEETIRKCVGVEGSEEPLTAGLYTYVHDGRVVSEFESCLRRNAPPLLRIANSQKPGVAFDFTARNMVFVAEGEQCLVDLDRINDLDMPRFFARFTEMSDFIEEKRVVIDADVRVGANVLCQKGAVVSSKDLLFCDFLARLYAVADDSLKGEIDSHAGEWLRHFPAARFSKALRHFGSFSHWSRKYANQGQHHEAAAAKRHGLNCLENVVRSIDDVMENLGPGADLVLLNSLKDSFQDLIATIKVAGLDSDMHVHGANSHCVARKYHNRYQEMGLAQKLAYVRERLSEKLESAKGRREHVCIVEHTRFVEYGLPFRLYRQALEEVKRGYARDFVSVSFGLELDLERVDGHLELDLAQLDERAGKDRFDLEEIARQGLSGQDLSVPEEVVAAADVLLVGLHYKAFREGEKKGGYTIKGSEDYVAMLAESARMLVRLKRKYGRDKIYVLTHPWKCAADINGFNEADDFPERISYPDASTLDGFFRIVYDNDLVLEVNTSEINRQEAVQDRGAGNNTSNSIIDMAIRYYEERNAREGNGKRLLLARSSDAHHHAEEELVGMDDLARYIPSIESDVVVINRR